MKTTLAENVRALRRERPLTQEQLAEALGVTPGAVYKWEAGLSVPELPLILEMADFFDVSVDALLGHDVRDGSLSALAERLNALCRNSDPAALEEAEKALRKYPNNFTVVHGCAQIYNVFGSEGHDGKLLRRALELYEKALLLISQNRSPYISEQTIHGDMGVIHLLLGESEKGLDILKKHNAGGMFDDAIGGALSLLLRRPKEAEPYLADALRGKVFDQYGIVAGLAFVFRSRGDWSAEEEIVRWGLTVFSGIRNGGVTGYLDKVEAVLRLLLADARLESGRREEARASVGEAAALAAAFDAAPDHGIADLRFVPGPADSSVHDVLGGTAAESTAFLLERLDHPELSYLWREATKGSAGASGENEGVDR